MKTFFLKISILSALFLFCAKADLSQKLLWEFSTENRLPQALAVDPAPARPYLYVAQKSGGLLILELSENRPPTETAQLPKTAFKGLDAMNLVQRGEHLYIALGSFFNAAGDKAGLAIVDVKDPRRPKTLSVWTSVEKIKGSAIVEVAGDYAYLGAMQEGVFIFDISDKKNPKKVSAIQPDIHFPQKNPNRTHHPNARGLAVRGDLLYVANDAGGLRVIDVSDKKKPLEVAKYINAGVKNKPQAYNNIVLDFPYAYIAVDYCGMEVVNIRNPKNIRPVGWWNPWGCETFANTWFNSQGHTNQLVYDQKKKLVFLSAGDSELQIVDVSDPRKPDLQKGFGQTGNKLGVWGLTASDEIVYLAYIKTFIPFRGTWSGIKAVKK
ncbi:MAG: hypothetical protein R2747_13445 [Pyrinomonadaceae bacterium]